MKRFLSALLTALMFVSAFALSAGAGHLEGERWVPENDVWEPIEKGENVVARFAIGADLHMGAGQYYPYDKLDYTFRALAQIGGVDMLGICGDVTDDSTVEAYAEVMELVRANADVPIPETGGPDYTFSGQDEAVGTVLLSMGNHEYHNTEDRYVGRFEECTGQDACGLYWINGVPIIKISPADERDSGNYKTKEIEDFILDSFAAIKGRGYDGVIIGMAHHRVLDDYYSEAEIEAFGAHPNFILFTGHSHTFYYNTSEFIDQDLGFTHIRAGVLGHFWGGTNNPVNPETGRTGDPLTDNCENSCALVLVDVLKDGTARLRRIDIAKGEYVFGDEDFIVDPDDLIYKTGTEAGTYGSASAAPTFPGGAAVTVTDEGNHDTIVVHFPSATPASDKAYDYIWRYRIRLKRVSDGENFNTYVLNDSHVTEQRSEWHVPIVGLKPDTDYEVRVVAQTSYKVNSAALVYDGVVNVGHVEFKPAEPILTVNASGGSYDDIYGRELLEKPVRIRVRDDGDIGKKVLNFMVAGAYGYSFGPEDFSKIQYGFTYEAYFKATDVDTTQFIMGSHDAASSGLRIQDGQLHLWGNFRSMNNAQMNARLIASADVEQNVWYHAVAVYDGLEVRLYLNGVLADTGEVSGGLDEPPFEHEDPMFFIGDFASASDGIRYAFSGSVNLVRVYEGVMTEEQVAEAYAEATKKAPVWTGVVTPPTCTEQGYTTYTSDEGAVYVDDYVEALGHDYVTQTTAPTCTVRGYTIYTCSRCGDNFVDDYIDALGHDYSVVTAAPTCTESGYTAYTCRRCGDEYEENITAALGHLFGKDGKAAKCDRCGEANPDQKPSQGTGFDDVPADAYYAEAVSWAVESGITRGVSATKFGPDNGCTRGQVVTFLWRAAGAPSPSGSDNPFSDVRKGDYFYDAVLWAVENGITAGTSRTTFSPDATCTRGQIVTFLWRANGAPAVKSTSNPFSDVRSEDYYYVAVLWAVENNITKGTGATAFSPSVTCTRAQIVTFLYRDRTN